LHNSLHQTESAVSKVFAINEGAGPSDLQQTANLQNVSKVFAINEGAGPSGLQQTANLKNHPVSHMIFS
jgi:hypothetical protein